jgi:hypothetical protein
MLGSGSVGGCAGRILFSVVGRSSCGPLAPLQVRTPPRPLPLGADRQQQLFHR